MAELFIQFKGKVKSLGRLKRGMGPRVKKGLARAGAIIQRDVMEKLSGPSHVRFPGHSNPFPGVDTGRLRASVTSQYDPSGPRQRVGTGVRYAPFLEFGTDKMPDGYPFMAPAVDDKMDAAVDELAKTVLRPIR